MQEFLAEETDSEYYSENSDEEVSIVLDQINIKFLITFFQLQDAFARGILKPGLNIEYESKKVKVNDVVSKIKVNFYCNKLITVSFYKDKTFIED